MKFFPATLVASLALASVYAAETAPAAACDLSKLRPLLMDPDLTTCSTDSGLMFPPASVPDAELLTKVCSVPACSSLVKKVAALNLGDCTLGAVKINSELIKPVQEKCGASSGSSTTAPASTAQTNSTNSTTGTTGTTTTVTTAPVTVAGNVGSGSGDATVDKSDSTTESPVAATKLPSPSPTVKTASASTLSMAAAGSLVVAAVVALF